MKQSIVFRGSICCDRYRVNFLKDSVLELRKWFSGKVIVSTWIGQEKNAEFHPMYMTEQEYDYHFLNRYGTSVKG